MLKLFPVTEFGDLADFIRGNRIVYPPARRTDEVTGEIDQLDAIEARSLYLKAVENIT